MAFNKHSWQSYPDISRACQPSLKDLTNKEVKGLLASVHPGPMWGMNEFAEKFPRQYQVAARRSGEIDWLAMTKEAQEERQMEVGSSSNFIMTESVWLWCLHFEDDVICVVEVMMSPPELPYPEERHRCARQFYNRLAARKMCKQAHIPTPYIVAHHGPGNPDPYIIYELPENVFLAEEDKVSKDVWSFDFPDDDRWFRDDLALMQVMLSAFRFQKIGGIYWSPEKQEFYVGPDPVTGEGPWDTAAEYYRAVVERAKKDLSSLPHSWKPEEQYLIGGFGKAKRLLDEYVSPEEGGFRVTLGSLGVNNMLISRETKRLEALRVVDHVVSAPVDVVAQFPAGSVMELKGVKLFSNDLSRNCHTYRMHCYRQTVKEKEILMFKGDEVGRRMASAGALAYFGFLKLSHPEQRKRKEWCDLLGHLYECLQQGKSTNQLCLHPAWPVPGGWGDWEGARGRF
ncbi:hypothetical protein CTRI78_v000394 [Colletotrichum trifolii]|uniref:Aminoglycoside phosphotransferase domain-containing protein n=1 Tax=Colletotrichum trifolii TaxID=5466 RepID=A0A4R8RSF3_COLTR|nr:hypothetical protein CTRI78_v000394 [Colletotrichum trifolii]